MSVATINRLLYVIALLSGSIIYIIIIGWLHPSSISKNQSIKILTTISVTNRSKALHQCFSQFHSKEIGWRSITQSSYDNISIKCNIYLNATYKISFIILNTFHHKLFKVKSLNSIDLNTEYLIKPNKHPCQYFNYNIPESHSDKFKEYKIMQYLTGFADVRANTISIYRNYPLMKWRMHDHDVCIIFIQYLPNVEPLSVFMHPTLHINMQNIDQIIHFLIKCYKEMSTVLDRLWTFEGKYLVHNDLWNKNILVDMDSYKCYLIDYEMLFEYGNVAESNLLLRGKIHTQNPFAAFYLWNKEMRHKFIEEHGNTNKTFQMIINYGYLTQKYKLRFIILDIATKYFQNTHLDKLMNNIYSSQYEESIAAEKNPKKYTKMNNRKYMRLYEKLKKVWCLRYNQLLLMVDLVHKSKKYNKYTRVFRREIVDKLLKQLRQEMNQTNVHCST
eukprot:355182_1